MDNRKINKPMLADEMVKKYGITKKSALDMITKVSTSIGDELVKGNDVYIPKFMNFIVKPFPARETTNPVKPTERIQVKKTRTVRPKLTNELKRRIQGKNKA